MHPRNKHRERYDFKQLSEACPQLKDFVQLNAYQDESIDFADAKAVKMLNTALLKHFYQIDHWTIPDNYLCPPIPGRADYLHHIADLLASKSKGILKGILPKGPTIKCLDIGVGASCIYPLIGSREYAWSFVGSELDPISVQSARQIIEANKLTATIEIRQQTAATSIFSGIIQKGEHYHLSICNPPFHASEAEAQAANLRKVRNLNPQKPAKPQLNFGGQHAELWYKGGEVAFIEKMIQESQIFSKSCEWFSTLVSKKSNLRRIYKALKTVKAKEIHTIDMGQGNKISRIVAWSFSSPSKKA